MLKKKKKKKVEETDEINLNVLYLINISKILFQYIIKIKIISDKKTYKHKVK